MTEKIVQEAELRSIGSRRRNGLCQKVFGIGLGSFVLALAGVLGELRDGDGGQNTDDRDYDHQFDQGKAFLQLLHGAGSFQ